MRLPLSIIDLLGKLVLDVISAEDRHLAGKGEDKLDEVINGAMKRAVRLGIPTDTGNPTPTQFIDIIVDLINAVVALMNLLGIFKKAKPASDPA